MRERKGAGDNGGAPEWLFKLRQHRVKREIVTNDIKTATPFYIQLAETQVKHVKATVYNDYYFPPRKGAPEVKPPPLPPQKSHSYRLIGIPENVERGSYDAW